MYDIITFGSATWDIFMKTDKFQVVKNKSFITGKGLCLSLGSKINIDQIAFSSGGGGTNSAVTFANQGFKTAYSGMVGNDIGGDKIIDELKGNNVDTKFIVKTSIKSTNHSVVLSDKGKRTILVYRGASELLSKRDIQWNKLKTKWFYLAPLSGMLAGFSKDIVDFAHKNKIKVAFNPGTTQLSLSSKILKEILEKVDILILNQEEASLLTGIPFEKEKEIFKKIDQICPGIAIMTKGNNGVVVSDGKNIYKAKPLKIKVVDETGAGDSFSAGFVTGFINSGGDIESAIQFGIANANACLSGLGSKSNLLKKGDKFAKISIKKELCSENGLCKTK
ncbi:MAG: carbohydrate kinase family protein [Candidatus Nealsonbacteria bacterium]